MEREIMDYEKLFEKSLEEFINGDSNLMSYVERILKSQKEILDIMDKGKFLNESYWYGVIVGGNSDVEYSLVDGNYLTEIKKFGEPTLHQKLVERKIHDRLYDIKYHEEIINFIERMINEERPREYSNDIWEGFMKGRNFNWDADINRECFNNAIPYLGQHFEKLEDYIEKWDMYKEMFDRIELGAEPEIKRESFNQRLGDKNHVKKSLTDRTFD